MPSTQVALVRRQSRSRSFHGRFWAEMRNDHIVPCVAVLVAKDNKMIRHRIMRIGCFEPIAQLRCLAERRPCEMHVINISPFPSPDGRGLLFTGGGFW